MAITNTSIVARPVTRRPNAPVKRTQGRGNGGLTPRIRRVIDAIVFDGRTRNEAAQDEGITENAAYQALRKPAVLAYWNEQLKVLRSGARARNLHRAFEIRDQDGNLTAAMQALKWLEPQEHQGVNVSINNTFAPGIVIGGVDPEYAERARQLEQLYADDAKPLIEHDEVGEAE